MICVLKSGLYFCYLNFLVMYFFIIFLVRSIDLSPLSFFHCLFISVPSFLVLLELVLNLRDGYSRQISRVVCWKRLGEIH